MFPNFVNKNRDILDIAVMYQAFPDLSEYTLQENKMI